MRAGAESRPGMRPSRAGNRSSSQRAQPREHGERAQRQVCVISIR